MKNTFKKLKDKYDELKKSIFNTKDTEDITAFMNLITMLKIINKNLTVQSYFTDILDTHKELIQTIEELNEAIIKSEEYVKNDMNFLSVFLKHQVSLEIFYKIIADNSLNLFNNEELKNEFIFTSKAIVDEIKMYEEIYIVKMEQDITESLKLLNSIREKSTELEEHKTKIRHSQHTINKLKSQEILNRIKAQKNKIRLKVKQDSKRIVLLKKHIEDTLKKFNEEIITLRFSEIIYVNNINKQEDVTTINEYLTQIINKKEQKEYIKSCLLELFQINSKKIDISCKIEDCFEYGDLKFIKCSTANKYVMNLTVTDIEKKVTNTLSLLEDLKKLYTEKNMKLKDFHLSTIKFRLNYIKSNILSNRNRYSEDLDNLYLTEYKSDIKYFLLTYYMYLNKLEQDLKKDCKELAEKNHTKGITNKYKNSYELCLHFHKRFHYFEKLFNQFLSEDNSELALSDFGYIRVNKTIKNSIDYFFKTMGEYDYGKIEIKELIENVTSISEMSKSQISYIFVKTSYQNIESYLENDIYIYENPNLSIKEKIEIHEAVIELYCFIRALNSKHLLKILEYKDGLDLITKLINLETTESNMMSFKKLIDDLNTFLFTIKYK